MGRLDYEFKEIKMSTYKRFCIRFDQTLKKAGFKKAQILETFEDQWPKKMYTQFKIPGMGLRDSLTEFDWNQRPDGKLVWTQTSIESPEYPVRDDTIRVDEWKAALISDDDDKWFRATEFSFHQAYFPAEMDLSPTPEDKIKAMRDFYKTLKKI